ncbi:MAG: copper-exporting ATPase [Myxococcaceae bacterium]|nr:copper-exporting ATPase [Myxococcaceae bacterium]
MTPELTRKPSEPEAGPHRQRSDFPVHGMTCAGCVGRVERALTKVPGVQEARVNLATQRATVHHDPTLVSASALAQAVESAGYLVPAASRARGASAPSSAKQRALALALAEARSERGLRRDLLLAALLTAPLLVLAMAHGALPARHHELVRALQLVLATPVMFGPGARFLQLAWRALRQRTSDMNTLVSLGALAAYGYSALAVLAPALFVGGAAGAHGMDADPPLYFEAGAAIVTFVLLGRLLELRARRRLSAAVQGLGALLPQTATRVLAGNQKRFETIDVAMIASGDLLLVRAGERVPNDGLVVEGTAAVDESMLTGESAAVSKREDSKVYGGTLLQDGSLTVRATETGAETTLARIVEAVEQAQGSRAPVARMADRVSAYFVPLVLAIALLTLGVWLAIDASALGLAFAVERFVTVLVIACPCALGLATPAAVVVATGRAAELGVLFKGGSALEAASQLQTLLFDKTGTLTEGRPVLGEVVTLPGRSEDELLALVAAVEQRSQHPIARALVEAAERRRLPRYDSAELLSQAGAGAEALVNGQRVRVGTARWLEAAGISTATLEGRAEQLAALGHTPSFVAIDGLLAAVLALADRSTPEAARALHTLRQQGYELAMLTGDRQGTAEAVARELGLTRVFAGLSPRDKARLVSEEKQRGRRVALVGDGINDAPALAAADVGIAVGGGSDIALATADVVLLRGGVALLPSALGLARATLHTIRQNLFWAFVYNLVGIPLAAGALLPFTGWLLSPVFASAAMSLSSVSVLASSLRLRRYRPEGSTS